MTHQEFRARFRGSAIERSKRRGLLRNVCVAMGNSGNRAFIPLLESLLDDEETLVREHAAWALAQLREPTPAPPSLLP
jgi:epoxyqueuosine reductase